MTPSLKLQSSKDNYDHEMLYCGISLKYKTLPLFLFQRAVLLIVWKGGMIFLGCAMYVLPC